MLGLERDMWAMRPDDDGLVLSDVRPVDSMAHSQLIDQGIPNRSTRTPNRFAQKVFWSGISILPFSASA